MINIKETIISSFFFHLVLLLLMISVSSYTSGISGGIRNFVTVDLTTEKSEDPSEARTDSGDAPPQPSSLPSNEQMSLPDQAVNNPAEEPKNVPQEKKPEAAAGPAKIENTEIPAAQKQDAGSRVTLLVGEALSVNKREFFGGTAIVSLVYGADGRLAHALVDSASPDLKAFLEEISWDAVPAPIKYSLGSINVQIEFTVLEGYLSYRISGL